MATASPASPQSPVDPWPSDEEAEEMADLEEDRYINWLLGEEPQ